MITSYKEYKYYLQADKISLGISKKRPSLVGNINNDIWKFQRLLRKTEYFNNVYKNKVLRLYVLYLKYKLKCKGKKLGYSIPINVAGPGLALAHAGTIVINHKARIGKNCRMHVCVNIGFQAGTDEAPIIGDNV